MDMDTHMPVMSLESEQVKGRLWFLSCDRALTDASHATFVSPLL